MYSARDAEQKRPTFKQFKDSLQKLHASILQNEAAFNEQNRATLRAEGKMLKAKIAELDKVIKTAEKACDKAKAGEKEAAEEKLEYFLAQMAENKGEQQSSTVSLELTFDAARLEENRLEKYMPTKCAARSSS